MDKFSKCLNRKNCIDGANYKIAEKCNKYRPQGKLERKEYSKQALTLKIIENKYCCGGTDDNRKTNQDDLFFSLRYWNQ